MALVHRYTPSSHRGDGTSADTHPAGQDREVSWSDACFAGSGIYDSNKIRNKVKLQTAAKSRILMTQNNCLQAYHKNNVSMFILCPTVGFVGLLLFQSVRARGCAVL